VYGAAVLDCIAWELLEAACQSVPSGAILPRHITASVAGDAELSALLREDDAGEPQPGESSGPLPQWYVDRHQHDDEEDAAREEEEAPWTALPAWLDAGLAWELGDMALKPLREACEACVVLAEGLLVPGSDSASTATAYDRGGLSGTCRDALAVSRWLRSRPPFEPEKQVFAAVGTAAVAESVPSSPGGAHGLELPAALVLPQDHRDRLLKLLARVDTFLASL
jgi:hypothetical protein